MPPKGSRRSIALQARSWFAALFVLSIVCLPRIASAQPAAARDTFWTFPEGVVAYWVWDAEQMGKDPRTCALAAAGLRGLISNAANVEGGSLVADALLRGRVLDGASYRVCLLALEGESSEPKGKRDAAVVLHPKVLSAVIEVRTSGKDGGHDRLLAAVDQALTDQAGDRGKPRDRKELALPGGLKAQASTTGDDWAEVAWVSKSDMFVVGFGKGTLEKWINARPGRAQDAAWWSQRAVISKKRGKGTRAFEVFVDLNALRRGVPDEFALGALGRLVHGWHIANDRTFMIHGMFAAGPKTEEGKEDTGKAAGPRLLAIDVSWSSRAEAPETWHDAAISEAAWPGDAGGLAKPTSGSWAILARSSVPSWIDLGLDTYEALTEQKEFAGIRSRWTRRTTPMLERLAPRLGEWVLLTSGSDLTITLKPAGGPDRFAADFRALMSTLAPGVSLVGKSWMLSAEGAEADLKGAAWRIRDDGAALVTSWEAEKKK